MKKISGSSLKTTDLSIRTTKRRQLLRVPDSRTTTLVSDTLCFLAPPAAVANETEADDAFLERSLTETHWSFVQG